MELLIKNGRIIDPKSKTDACLDILVRDGIIVEISKNIDSIGKKVIDAEGLIVVPGFIDLHVHLREPGFEYKETIKTGTAAAAAGGFTSVACMPNTNPAIHSKEVINYISSKAKEEGLVKVFIIGSITKDLEGREITPIKELFKAGAVAISDDGKTTMDSEIMSKAFKITRELNIPIISHCEDHNLSRGGSVNLGNASLRTNLVGIPAEAEYKIVERDINLSKEYLGKLHIAHVSVKESIDIIRRAKVEGIKVTCEVCPHHFLLEDDIITVDNTYTKVNPPIRGKEDVLSVIEGIKDGTIDIIATDHAPHDEDSKNISYDKAAFGISGIETAFSLSYTGLVLKGHISLMKLIEMMTNRPAEILGIDGGEISIGKPGDLTIIDLNEEYTIDSSNFFSKGKNTPFNGMKVRGKPQYTIVGGNIIYERGRIKCL